MKKYIIFTCEIHPIGGTQTYTAAKVRYLESQGYKVYIFYDGPKIKGCRIKELNKFYRGGFSFLEFPPFVFDDHRLKKNIASMISIIDPSEDDEIFIESQTDVFSFWAELISKEINAKHIIFCCNETFRDPGKYYKEYIDYFFYKYKRNELFGINEKSLQNLFEGFDYDIDNKHFFTALEDGDVQEIDDRRIKKIKDDKSLKICYFGRSTKEYTDFIIEGVFNFSLRHPTEKICFIFIGSTSGKDKMINDTFRKTKNVKVIRMGDMVPVPKKIFKEIDVVIAGSGCAIAAVHNGVPVIVADCKNYNACGVLGYTIDNPFHSTENIQYKYEDLLEDVFYEKKYLKNKFYFPKKNPEITFGSQLKLFDNIMECEYYSFEEKEEVKLNKSEYLLRKIRLQLYGIYIYIKNTIS